jgi:hypothetical protein
MGFLARNTVAKSYKRFRSRINAVVAADSNFIEYIASLRSSAKQFLL